MKNSHLNKPIIFIDKKAELEKRNRCSKLHITRLHDTKVIGYEEHKKLKIHEIKKQKILNSKLYKFRKKIITLLIVILSLFVIMSLWNKFYKPTYKESTNNFNVERQYLSSSDKSTYSSIIKESVQKILNIKHSVKVEQIHRNGNLIFANGYFNVPNKGDINFDIILENYTPSSLRVNGVEYVKK